LEYIKPLKKELDSIIALKFQKDEVK
jgi:hypothetical protein